MGRQRQVVCKKCCRVMRSDVLNRHMKLHEKLREDSLDGVATIVQGTIVQGDSCPRDFSPMTQLSKQTIFQGDFCPRSKSDEEKAAH